MGGRKDIWKDGEKTQFKPGESGNPDGRPKGVQNSKTRLMRFLAQEIEMPNPATEELEKCTVLEAMDAAQIQKALSGDTAAFRELLDRFEGKVDNKTQLKIDGKVHTVVDWSDDEPGADPDAND